MELESLILKEQRGPPSYSPDLVRAAMGESRGSGRLRVAESSERMDKEQLRDTRDCLDSPRYPELVVLFICAPSYHRPL